MYVLRGGMSEMFFLAHDDPSEVADAYEMEQAGGRIERKEEARKWGLLSKLKKP